MKWRIMQVENDWGMNPSHTPLQCQRSAVHDVSAATSHEHKGVCSMDTESYGLHRPCASLVCASSVQGIQQRMDWVLSGSSGRLGGGPDWSQGPWSCGEG